MVLQCNRTLESAFAGIEQHVSNVAPRIPTTQRNGMGSASVEFPPSHSTAFGDPLWRLKEPFMKNLILFSGFHTCYYHIIPSLCYDFITCLLHLDLYVAVVFSHLIVSLHTYALAVPILFASNLPFDGWRVSANPPCIHCISDELVAVVVVVVVFLLHCSISRYIPSQIQHTILLRILSSPGRSDSLKFVISWSILPRSYPSATCISMIADICACNPCGRVRTVID